MMDWFMLDITQLSHFHLLRPLWLLALIPLTWTMYHLYKARSPFDKWQKIIAPNLIKAMRVRHTHVKRFNPLNVFSISAILIVIVLAGPTWKQQASPFSEDLSALVIVLDASASMEQQDVQPSRLERAKQKIQDLLALRPGGRVGLIVYAGSAHSVIPLTNDMEVVNNFLQAVTSDMMPKSGKFAEKALPIADSMLQVKLADGVEIKGTLVLLTDGVGPETNTEFENYFSNHQHQLLVLGMGDNSSALTTAGSIPLEEKALTDLANNSGGYYQALSLDKSDVNYLNRRINSHLVIVEDGTRPWFDSGYYLLYPLIFLMLFWFRKGWTLNWSLMVIVTLLYSQSPELMASEADLKGKDKEQKTASIIEQLEDKFLRLWLTPDQLGQFYMLNGHYARAAKSYDALAWRGIAYYRAEDFKAATEMFSRIDSIEGHFNLANAWAHSRNYINAVKSYNQVVKLDAAHKDDENSVYQRALKNRDSIQKIIDEINLLSASQKAENTDSTRDLPDDQPQTGDGAEREDFIEQEIEQLSAEDILLDDSINELWMRQVQKDPSHFLRVKFHMQLEQ